MRRLIAPTAVLAVLALAGCSSPAPEPTSTPAAVETTAAAVTDITAATTVDQAVTFVLANADGMTAQQTADAATVLNKLATAQYSDAKYAPIKTKMNALTIDAVKGQQGVQARLVELAKQIRELG
ncbi:hypothetical protein [uncultured Microbacterium sp.]|uniref:hypothetical protein n=1 Tax=uncultured Microbacterium sp. TaxID=191216 RepID=UPI0025DB6D26|nr:hypothetical protein [uncultured Microbacterium sp.]